MPTFLFSGQGRLDRLGYLVAVIVAALLFCAPIALIIAASRSHGDQTHAYALQAGTVAAGTAGWLAALWIYCAATARRLHDLNRSGWLTLLALLPAVGLGALTVVLLTFPGGRTRNRYGEPWFSIGR